MKQCFGYVRVSTQKQGDGVSLEAQRDAIEQFAVRNALEVSQWFEEKVTAAKSGRPVFNAMIKLLMRGKAQGVVMHKIDRSARNFADWARIGDLSDAGIDVHFASETLDFRSRGGRLAADIQAVIAADYIRNLREETLKGMNGRLKQGLFPWGAPLGYLNNGKGKPKTADPVRSPLIKRLFELYASGAHSIISLREEMERLGLKNARGNVVSKGGIETILSNSFYCGIIRVRKTGETYAGCHEPLISSSLFSAVQDRKAGRTHKKVTRRRHIYAGLFRCALCQTAMIPERQKGHVYYRCHTRACPTKSMREEAIEDAVCTELRDAGFTEAQRNRMEEAVAEWFAVSSQDNQLNALQLQIDQVDARMKRLTDLLIDETIPRDRYATKNDELIFERARLLDELTVLRRNRPRPDDAHQFLELISDLETRYISADRAIKRQIVELATSNRFVSPRNLSVEPQNWLMAPSFLVSALCGALARNRT